MNESHEANAFKTVIKIIFTNELTGHVCRWTFSYETLGSAEYCPLLTDITVIDGGLSRFSY